MRFSAVHKLFWGGVLAAALVAVPALDEALLLRRAEASTPPAVQSATSQDDQVDLAVTVYNSNIALVRDVREVRLASGAFSLQFRDIAATVNPATVHFRSLTEPARLSVLEQNYEYDLLEPMKLLQKYVGREVTLVRLRQESGSTQQEEVRALLLAFNNGPVWKIGNEIVTGMHADHIRFPELPENLYSRPTLVWMLDNRGVARHRVETSYLAGGLSWSSDYVLTVGRDEKIAGLNGWVTLVNNSGTAFKNAKLQLVAGDLNRVKQMLQADAVEAREMLARAAASPQFAREAFSEYHLYSLARRTSVNDI